MSILWSDACAFFLAKVVIVPASQRSISSTKCELDRVAGWSSFKHGNM